MSLKTKITDDMKAAMRAKDTARLSAIRLLLAAMKQKEVDERVELSDTDVVTIIDKMLKQRRESIKAYEAGKRQDLAEAEQFEVGVLQEYMPKALADDEVNVAIAMAIDSSGAKAMSDMGKVMAVLKPQLAGRADMSKVSALVKAKLAGTTPAKIVPGRKHVARAAGIRGNSDMIEDAKRKVRVLDPQSSVLNPAP